MTQSKLIPALFLCVLLFSTCGKKEKPIFVKGRALHVYTHAPLEGMEIQVTEVRNVWFSVETEVKGKGMTDANGEFVIKVEKLNQEYSYQIANLFPAVPDSNKAATRFFPGIAATLNTNELQKEITMQLTPSGCINAFVPASTWDSIPCDSIIISSPYVTKKIVRGEYLKHFLVDVSQYTTLSWYYVAKGVAGKTNNRRLFVPNGFQTGNSQSINYTLTFE